MPLKDGKSVNQIDLKPETKRKEIGFETESVLDSSWKEIKVEYNKLGVYYSKLAKKNLTGEYFNRICDN